MFVECKRVVHFWQSIETIILQKTGIHKKFSNFDIIFGYLLQDQNRIPINALILVTKKCIYDAAKSKSDLLPQVLQHRLEQIFLDEKLVSVLNNTENQFTKNWGNLEPLFH